MLNYYNIKNDTYIFRVYFQLKYTTITMESNPFCNDPLSGLSCRTGDLGRRLFGNNPATIANEIVQIECRLLELHIQSILSNKKKNAFENELLSMLNDIHFLEIAFDSYTIDRKLKSNIMKYHYKPEFKKSIIQMILILQIKKRLLPIATACI